MLLHLFFLLHFLIWIRAYFTFLILLSIFLLIYLSFFTVFNVMLALLILIFLTITFVRAIWVRITFCLIFLDTINFNAITLKLIVIYYESFRSVIFSAIAKGLIEQQLSVEILHAIVSSRVWVLFFSSPITEKIYQLYVETQLCAWGTYASWCFDAESMTITAVLIVQFLTNLINERQYLLFLWRVLLNYDT